MRDFVHVSDIARANRMALDRAFRREPGVADVLTCNVSSGDPHTVGEFATVLAEAMDGPAPQVVGGGRPGDVRHVVADPGLAAEVLGFQAQTSFRDGVTDFAAAPLRSSIRV